MEARNCKDCGKMFNYMGGTPLCPVCAKKLDEKFLEVKEYVYDNPHANLNQVAEDNEVSVAQIKRWIKEEKLSFSEDSPIGLECEKCGKIIKTGRFCQNCKKELEDHLGNVYTQPKENHVKKNIVNTAAKMRFLDK